MHITTKEFEKRVQQTVREWKTEGEEGFDMGDGKFIPKHPGYIYRLSGDWKGWSDFLDSTDLENVLQDVIEDEAWKRINKK